MARALIISRWSFGLRQMFFWTAAFALSLIALRSASMTWVAAILVMALSTLAASILLAVYRRGVQRSYWIGFATFGWLYLLFLVFSWTLGRTTSNDSPLRAQNLLTQRLSTATYHWLYDKAFDKYYAMQNMGSSMGSMGGDAGYSSAGMMAGGMPMVSATGDPSVSAGPMPLAPAFATPGSPPGPSERDFVNVAHLLWTLLFAATGGYLACLFYSTGPGRSEGQPTTVS